MKLPHHFERRGRPNRSNASQELLRASLTGLAFPPVPQRSNRGQPSTGAVGDPPSSAPTGSSRPPEVYPGEEWTRATHHGHHFQGQEEEDNVDDLRLFLLSPSTFTPPNILLSSSPEADQQTRVLDIINAALQIVEDHSPFVLDHQREDSQSSSRRRASTRRTPSSSKIQRKTTGKQ